MIPHEIISKNVLPSMRAIIAHKLSERGLGQLRISKLIGTSQPMVNKYLSFPLEYYLSELAKIGINSDDALRIAELLSDTLILRKKEDFMLQLTSYMNYILKCGCLCDFHKKINQGLPNNCDICSKLFAIAEDPLVDEVKKAFQLLKNKRGSANLVPAVGMNIVAAYSSAKTPADIIGFSGKIIDENGRLVAVGEPIRGGSRHLASVLLEVMKKFPSIRGAIVIKYSEECLQKLKEGGQAFLTIGPHSSAEEILRDISQALFSEEKKIDAIFDRGGVGIEPVIYLFGKDAIEAVKKAFICLGN